MSAQVWLGSFLGSSRKSAEDTRTAKLGWEKREADGLMFVWCSCQGIESSNPRYRRPFFACLITNALCASVNFDAYMPRILAQLRKYWAESS